MKVTGCQWDLAWENREENFAAASRLLSDDQNPDLIVLPEMFSSGFSMNVETIQEPEPSPTETFLKTIAMEKEAASLGGLVRRSSGGPGRNELIAFDDEGIELARYQKNRSFRPGGELDHYENGTEGSLFQIGDWTIAPFICYDLRFPELFRRSVREGAELIVVIANWPTPRVEHWLALLRARAIENLAYVVGVNRCGADPNYDFPGRSVIYDFQGKVLADAGNEEGLCEAELDREVLLDWRESFPALQDLTM